MTAEVTQAIEMEASQCVGEQDFSESANTEEQNSQNESDYKIAWFTINGRLKSFFVFENVVNLSHRNLSKVEVSLLSKV